MRQIPPDSHERRGKSLPARPAEGMSRPRPGGCRQECGFLTPIQLVQREANEGHDSIIREKDLGFP